jgi:hypothetical protein
VSGITVSWTDIKRQSGTQTQETQDCLVAGTYDKLQAELAILANSDEYTTFTNGMQLPRTQISADALGGGVWKGSVTWGTSQDNNKKTPVIQFDTDGGTQKITQSLQTLGSYAFPLTDVGGSPIGVSGTVTNYNGAIGVTKDGVEGVEVTVPTFKWTEKWWIPQSLCNAPYLKTLEAATGLTNLNAFRGFNQGEVLFLGASGGGNLGELWEVTFKFSASTDDDNLTVGSGAIQITGVNKPGWAYMWIRYLDKVDPTSKFAVKVPQQANVEQVYDQTDFAAFGIPQGASLSPPS